MIKNYIKIALRNIRRQKIYSLITMSGLILGLSVFIMFALLSDLTSNFDSCHENASRIHAVVRVLSSPQEGEQHSAFTPSPLVPALLSDFPEIEKIDDYGKFMEIRLKENADPQALLEKLTSRIQINKFEVREPTLNAIFIEKVGG